MKINLRFKSHCLMVMLFCAGTSVLCKTRGKNRHVSQKHDVSQKHVIAAWGYGFFADFHGVLNHLLWCRNTGHIPAVYWGKESLYYQPGGYNGSQNVWEYYFEPVSALSCSENEPRDSRHSPGAWWFFVEHYDMETRKIAKSLIDSHIKIKQPVQQKIDEFYQKNMQGKKTIGVHFRGTDKKVDYANLGITSVAYSVVFDVANKQAELLGPECKFLVATDEQAFLEQAKKKLIRPVIYYDCRRSTNGMALHAGIKKDRAVIGEDVLVEVQLLTRCDLFIHTYWSNVSLAVLYFNPDIQDILLK